MSELAFPALNALILLAFVGALYAEHAFAKGPRHKNRA